VQPKVRFSVWNLVCSQISDTIPTPRWYCNAYSDYQLGVFRKNTRSMDIIESNFLIRSSKLDNVNLVSVLVVGP